MGSTKVAVIGAGVCGLVALKNLREEGLDAQCFEERDSIGGVWKSTDGDKHSVLPSTVANKSKFKNSFTDFPFPREVPAFPLASQLGTRVTQVVRSSDDTKWLVSLRTGNQHVKTLAFDNVAVCIGAWTVPKFPEVEGTKLFNGRLIHSHVFKNPSDFEGMRVVIVGLGNTAADTATALVGHANKIYLAHRRGANLLPRWSGTGKPLDCDITRRVIALKYALNAISPALSEKFFNTMIQSLTNASFKLNPKWRIHPPPSIATHQPTISDDLVQVLENGSIASTPEIRRFTGPNEVEFEDGTLAEVDGVIYCTGFHRDFSLIPEVQSTRNSTPTWTENPNSDSQPLPRLYQNIFPPDRGDSIAFLNNFTFATGFFWIADLASMAIAQIWKGSSALPSQVEMNATIDAHHAWLIELPGRDTVFTDIVHEESWLRWMHETAGTGVGENLGYGFSGWKFWLQDPRFCHLIMGGVESPFANRLFDGKRKKWEGARQAIVDANEDYKECNREKRKSM